MKRWRRWLLNLLAGLSLILFLAAAGLWARSYSNVEDLVYLGRHGGSGVHVSRDRLAFVFENLMSSNPDFGYSFSTPIPGPDFANPPSGSHTLWNRMGFRFAQGIRPRSSSPQFINLPTGLSWPPVVSYTAFALPIWFLLLILALLPFWNFVLPIVLDFRRPSGCCANCCYDLRATPDRCPECGAVPPKREIISS